MTICHSLPADFCLRVVRAQAPSDRQTSPVRPANGHNSLIARVFAALRSGRLRFLPCFPLKNRRKTGTPAPLFAASARVISSTMPVKPARASSAGKLPHAKLTVTTLPRNRDNAIGKPFRFRGQCGGLLAVPCRGRGREKVTLPGEPGRPDRMSLIHCSRRTSVQMDRLDWGPHLILPCVYPCGRETPAPAPPRGLRRPLGALSRAAGDARFRSATRDRSGTKPDIDIGVRFRWCERRESNPHSLFGKRILSPLRLPVSPRSQFFRSPAQGRKSPLISCAWRSTGKAIAPARSAPRRSTPSI
jgi:hypothetical protein